MTASTRCTASSDWRPAALLAVAATKLYRGLEAASGAITATDEMGKSAFYYEKELNDRFLGVVT